MIDVRVIFEGMGEVKDAGLSTVIEFYTRVPQMIMKGYHEGEVRLFL